MFIGLFRIKLSPKNTFLSLTLVTLFYCIVLHAEFLWRSLWWFKSCSFRLRHRVVCGRKLMFRGTWRWEQHCSPNVGILPQHYTVSQVEDGGSKVLRDAGILPYEGESKSFRTGRLERELQMVHLSATRCSCGAILWVGIVSFAAITLCVASQRVFIVVSVYFVIDSVRKLLDTPSYNQHGNKRRRQRQRCPFYRHEILSSLSLKMVTWKTEK
jgi:hypothetical protein